MKRLFFSLFWMLVCAGPASAQYNDHRYRNLDSLENVVAGWTQERLSTAAYETQAAVALAYGDLMNGYERINPERAVYCARRAFETSLRLGSLKMPFRAARFIGQMFYNKEQYDSTLRYYGIAQTYADRMAAGEGGYSEIDVDDALSRGDFAPMNAWTMPFPVSTETWGMFTTRWIPFPRHWSITPRPERFSRRTVGNKAAPSSGTTWATSAMSRGTTRKPSNTTKSPFVSARRPMTPCGLLHPA